jgi:hypothetical protein
MSATLWHLYNLRESAFFQEQLTSDPDARYPIELFVGRQDEVGRLVGGILQKLGSSSRQTVLGPPGIGKSTLVQQAKASVAEHGVLSHPSFVSVGHADSTQTVLLRELSILARERLDASGVLVHLNNLENLSDEDAESAAWIIRDLRDPVQMSEGYHFVLVGTNEAIRTVVVSTRQVRDVFSLRRPLRPLEFPEIRELLQRRYEHLRVDARKAVRPPVTDEAVADLHALFGGNLRGLLLALEDAAGTLIEYGGAAGEPMSRSEIRYVLQGRYQEGIEANLDPTDARYLQRLAEAQLFDRFSQSDLVKLWGVGQGAVSKILKRLEGAGYVVAQGTGEPRGRGRPENTYAATAVTRLAYESPTTAPAPRD